MWRSQLIEYWNWLDLKIASKIDRYFRQTWISGKIFHFVLRHEKSPGKRKKCKSKFHLKKIQKRLCTLTKAALSEIISQTAFQSFFSSSDNSTKKNLFLWSSFFNHLDSCHWFVQIDSSWHFWYDFFAHCTWLWYSKWHLEIIKMSFKLNFTY